MGQGKENNGSKPKGDKFEFSWKKLNPFSSSSSENSKGSSFSSTKQTLSVGKRSTSLGNESNEPPKAIIREKVNGLPLGGPKRNSIGGTGLGMQPIMLSPASSAAIQFATTNLSLSPLMPFEAYRTFNDAPISETTRFSVNYEERLLNGQYLERSTIENFAITRQPKSISHTSSFTDLSQTEGTRGYPLQPAMGIPGKVGSKKFIAQQIPNIQDELQYVKLRKTGQNLCEESYIKKQVSGESIVQNPIKEEDEKENDWPPIAKPRPSLFKEHMNNSPSKQKKPIPLPRQNRRAAESKVEVKVDLENYCEIGKDALNAENEIESSFEHIEAPPKISGVNMPSEKLLIIQANHRLV